MLLNLQVDIHTIIITFLERVIMLLNVNEFRIIQVRFNFWNNYSIDH